MERFELIEAFRGLLQEHSPEELRECLIEAVGGELIVPVDDPILAPYAAMIETESKKIQRLKGQIGSKEPDKFQAKMLEAWTAIVVYLNRLVDVGGDIRLAGEIPRQQWNATTGHLSGWSGKDARPRLVVYIDSDPARPFLARGVSPFVHDARTILDGNTDPTGAFWKPYNIRKQGDIEQTFACWNVLELTDAYNPTADDDDLARIRDFDLSKGSLRMDPNLWPEPFRSAWWEGHPLYTFTGESKLEPWVKS